DPEHQRLRAPDAGLCGDDSGRHRHHVDHHDGHDDHDLESDVGCPEHKRRDVMSRKSRMKDIRQAKDRRAKRLAIGGIVVLAAVLAFEVPHVLKKSGGSSSAPPAATTTATDTSGTTAPTPSTATGTAAAAAVPVSSTKLTSSDVAPRRLKSQLYSFSHFSGKDPFVQQVTAASITNSPSTGASSGSSGTGASGAAAA